VATEKKPESRQRRRQYRRMARTRRRLADQQAREAVRVEAKAAYESGSSIRDIAGRHKLAFGTVRTLLIETGVTLRGRGGPNRTPRKSGDDSDA
jgi:hypothetical protein